MPEQKKFQTMGATLLRQIAQGQVLGVTRDDVLLGHRTRKAAARRLGKLVSDGYVAENLDLWPVGDIVGLRTSAIVTIRIDGSSLRADAQEFAKARKRPRRRLVPAHELLIYRVLHDTDTWIHKSRHLDSISSDGLPLLVVLDACIVHGGTFDIMISVMAKEPRELMRWVREVVNLTPHVRGTQTIQVAYRHSSKGDRARFEREHPEYAQLTTADDAFRA